MTAHPSSRRIDPDSGQVSLAAVDGVGDLEALRRDWQALERRDPEASLFLTWDWLASAFARHPGRWKVLTARTPDGTLVGILPLKYRVHWSKTQAAFQSEIEAGGRLIWSEYTGFLCDPAQQDAVLRGFARRLQDMPWSSLSLRYVASKARADMFLTGFPPDRFRTGFRDYRISGGKTDNLVCPQVALPGDFDTYLSGLSANTRQKIRRFTRRFLDSGEMRVTRMTPETLERDLGHLLRFWLAKWAPQKGAATARRVAGNYADVLRAAARLDALDLPVLWQGDRPLAALGHVLDRRAGRVHFIVAGRDEQAPIGNAGLLLHADSIRWAIGRGFGVYDFCHGDEPYKFSFGAEPVRVHYLAVRRRGITADQPLLDPMSAPEALERVAGFAEAGRLAEASAGSRQIAALLRS